MTAQETVAPPATTQTAHQPTDSKNGSEPDPRLLSGEGQTFLVGDTLYLRGLELADAKRASAWRDSPFPVSAERAEELVKEEIKDANKNKTWRFIACRRSDGAPVGSLAHSRWLGSLGTDVTPYADPAMTGHEDAKAEMLKLFVDYAFNEREFMSVDTQFDAGQETLRRGAEAAGMRHAALWREERWRDGRRWDGIGYQALNPKWVERLGDPGRGIDHAVAPDDPGRWRPRQYPTFGSFDGDPPKNAVMVGPRVYLRPLEMEDAEQVVLTERREPENFFDDGRRPESSVGFRNHVESLSKDDPPENIRFAVCLREDGTHIGSNGIWDVDFLNRRAETESWFHRPEYRGQGYGSEAKHLLLAYAFERLGLHMVYSWVWGPNTRSAAALRKQGYRDSGRFFWDGFKHGDPTFAFCFDFLAEEWRQMTERSRKS